MAGFSYSSILKRIFNADYANDDFVVGSDLKDDAGGTDRDKRLFFGKSKGSFRAGAVTGTQWDNTNVGNYSTAFGLDNKASGDYSMAIGTNNVASALTSLAGGNSSTASGENSTAIGGSCTASGTVSMATGNGALASRWGQRSHAGVQLSAVGDAQYSRFVADRTTTDATPSLLFFERGVLTSNTPTLTGVYINVLTIPINRAHRFTINAVAKKTASADCASWTITGTIIRGPSGDATFLATPTVVTETAAGASTWTLVATLDISNGTNNYLVLTATGQAATTINWVASIQTTEVGG